MKRLSLYSIIFLGALLASVVSSQLSALCCYECGDKEDMSHVGNFANHRLPAGYWAFNWGTYEAGTVLYGNFLQYTKLCDTNIAIVAPGVIYCPTNCLSIYAVLPVVEFRKLIRDDCHNGCDTLRGLGDFYMQAEYAYFKRFTECSRLDLSIVGGMSLPSGSDFSRCGSPIATLSFGAPGFFIGTTGYYWSERWFVYGGLGYNAISASNNCLKVGSFLLYEWSVGMNLGNPCGTTVDLVMEFNGNWLGRRTLNGAKDCRSGGNTLFMGPTLYISYDWYEFAAGVQLPIHEKFNHTATAGTLAEIFVSLDALIGTAEHLKARAIFAFSGKF